MMGRMMFLAVTHHRRDPGHITVTAAPLTRAYCNKVAIANLSLPGPRPDSVPVGPITAGGAASITVSHGPGRDSDAARGGGWAARLTQPGSVRRLMRPAAC